MAIGAFKLLNNLDAIRDKTPITADIFLTNFCNNNCGYCTYKRWKLHNPHEVSFDEFKKYADRLINLGVKGIILTGGGEPTLNKDFNRITAYLETNKIPYGINTNFNVFKKFNPTYLKVSLDAWDSATYKKIRGVDAYERVIDNIISYCLYRRSKKNKTSVGVQAVITKEEDAYKFYESVKGLDVDFIVMRPVESTRGSYYLNKENDTERLKIIEAIKSIKDVRINLNYKWRYTAKAYEKCYASFAQIAVDEYGDVMYCCHKPYEIVGNILDDDILDKKRNFKTNIKMCDVPCRLSGSNEMMKIIEGGAKESAFI